MSVISEAITAQQLPYFNIMGVNARETTRLRRTISSLCFPLSNKSSYWRYHVSPSALGEKGYLSSNGLYRGEKKMLKLTEV